METIQEQQLVQPAPKPKQRQKPAKSLEFPKGLLEDEQFIDPAKEAALIVPEMTVASTNIKLEIEAAPKFSAMKMRKRDSFFSKVYGQIVSWLVWVKKRFRGSRRQRARMTKQGERALEQLRYLAALCEITDCRTPDEVIEAEAAFGEAYYEIMGLSANLEKMSQKEEAHHVRRYEKHMSKLLKHGL